MQASRGGSEANTMDLYTRNVLVGIFAVLVMSTIIIGETLAWTRCDIDTAKSMVQKISLGISTSGTLFLVVVYLKDAKKQKAKAGKKSSYFSHDYHTPKLKEKR
jgi:hypothetical protein